MGLSGAGASASADFYLLGRVLREQGALTPQDPSRYQMRALAALMGRERRDGRNETVELENFRQRQTDERLEYLLDQMLAIFSPARYTTYLSKKAAAREAKGFDEDGLEYSGGDDPLIGDVSEHFDIEDLVRRGEESAPPGASLPSETI